MVHVHSRARSDLAHERARVRCAYVGRQQIFTGDLTCFGYEVLYRTSAANKATFSDVHHASRSTIRNLIFDFELASVVDSSLAFVNVSRDVVLEDIILSLPSERVVLELLETITPDREVLERLEKLCALGYRFALDDFRYEPDLEPLLHFASFVKVDVTSEDWEENLAQIRHARADVPRVAEKVENARVLGRCVELGFALFQGLHLAPPEILAKDSETGRVLRVL